MSDKFKFLGKSLEQSAKENEGQPGLPGEPGQEGFDGGGRGGAGGTGGRGGSAIAASHRRLSILKWAYLVIVIAATITLVIVVNENRNLVNDIQQDRKQVAYDICLDQNSRHDQLINFVIEINTNKTEVGKQIYSVDPVDIKFINLLAEKRNCKLLILNTFGSPIEDESS